MEVKYISYTYWRTIKRGSKNFQLDIVKSEKPFVVARADEIRWVAQQEVLDGTILVSDYINLIGEEYDGGDVV